MHDDDDNEEADSASFAAPPSPPPFLSEASLHRLVRQGWLPLTDTSLPHALTESTSNLFNELTTYFNHPDSKKTELYHPSSGTEWGHYDIPNEKQFLTLRCAVHPASPLEVHAARLWRDAAALLHRILGDLARSNDLSPDIWDDMLDGTLTLPVSERDASGTLLRMFRYEPAGGFAGEHTDLGLLTLCMGSAPGLECLDMERSIAADGEVWAQVDSPVVLVGQTVRGLSDGLINAGIHRVRATDQGRMSVVFALRHGWRKDVDLEKFGGVGRVKPRELYETMKIGVLNINAKGSLREKQLEELERRRRQEEELELRNGREENAEVGMG